MSNFNVAIKVILMHEGGWVDDPRDRGGETNFGISTLIIEREKITNEFLGLPADFKRTPGWMKSMKVEAAVKVYMQLFWDKYQYDLIGDQNMATKIFDCGVNCGPSRAHTMAQKALNDMGVVIEVDGSLGPKTFKALNSVMPNSFMARMRGQMEMYYNSIIISRPLNAAFKNNWMKRAAWGA